MNSAEADDFVRELALKRAVTGPDGSSRIAVFSDSEARALPANSLVVPEPGVSEHIVSFFEPPAYETSTARRRASQALNSEMSELRARLKVLFRLIDDGRLPPTPGWEDLARLGIASAEMHVAILCIPGFGADRSSRTRDAERFIRCHVDGLSRAAVAKEEAARRRVARVNIFPGVRRSIRRVARCVGVELRASRGGRPAKGKTALA